MDATVSDPWMVEISKHSIRRGSDGQVQHRPQRFERLVIRGRALAEARLVGQRGVSRREIDQAPLLAALRRQHLYTSPGADPQPLGHGIRIVDVGGQVDLRRDRAHLVELRERRLEHVDSLTTALPSLSVTSSMRSMTRPRRTRNTRITAPAGPPLTPKTSRSPELRTRHLLLLLVQRLDGPHRVAQLPGTLVLLRVGRLHHPLAKLLGELVARPSRNSFVSCTACRYSPSEQIVSTHGARHRLMCPRGTAAPACR